MVETPEQGRDRHVQHRELLAQHKFLLVENGNNLGQTVPNFLPGTIRRLVILFDRLDEAKDFPLHAQQQLACPRTHDGIGRHQLRMRETLVDIFVDDIRFEQNQIALNQNRYPVVRIDDCQVFRFVEHVHVNDLEIHAFLVQHDTAAMAERANGARIQIHHF
ncbi:MAG: hypothetical protein BWY57_02577 [Betaproteobacteria bacterium ADurb.Bin341]|nr:MAG: hypothetical protein BWY57_02577 [Betaproteobacteria bacterium ADurb.Bin341]